MENIWLKRWEDRYRNEEYAYGTEVNEFFKSQLDQLEPGKILFGAEGEGRNGIYAATKGWEVTAFDISQEGKNKALKLAEMLEVEIDYKVGELPELVFEEKFDVIALIYAHFPAEIKSNYHQILAQLVRTGGYVILEAFGKNHLEYRSKNEKIGGPTDLESLFSVEEIQSDFAGFEILVLEEKEIELSEGLYHNGKGSVVRFVGRKI